MNATKFAAVVLISAAFVSCTQYSQAKKRIYGSVEVDEIDVASRLPARVHKVAVKLGQKVKAGDVLVEFEDDVIAAKRKQAEAVIAAAESREAVAQDAVRPEEKEQLEQAVLAAKKQHEYAKVSLDRAAVALKEGAIAQQTYDEISFKEQAALAQYNAALAKQRMAKAGARKEDKAGAAALVNQAKSALLEVDSYVKDISVTSPVDGEVSQILNHEGELVPAGYPIITLLKLSEPWVTFQIPEDRLNEFPMGKDVNVTLPALNNKKLSGKVSYSAPMAGFANRSSTQDKGSFDLKTFEVRITFASADPDMRPGMTALVGAKEVE